MRFGGGVYGELATGSVVGDKWPSNSGVQVAEGICFSGGVRVRVGLARRQPMTLL